MKRPWRIWVAFVLAPLVSSGVGAVAFTALMSTHVTWAAIGEDLWLIVLIASAATVVLAVPTYLVLRRRRRIGLIHCILSGLVIGAVCGAAMGVVIGLLSGVLFWLIGIWRNDDIRVSAA